eukprot:CAMPEP_0185488008 /NCGR_PEP_ID=MMETSP1366-20130426/12054_1 /TAXON_ID=38817 /ORGANISM="Gephyrocapsa oceanica, Strain RCC1303" /LENGTH=173 /DNA_ID=CAMNT_0028096415 /DNA_START=34 /DNA_END=553 /DNA_ORIENTATION=+
MYIVRATNSVSFFTTSTAAQRGVGRNPGQVRLVSRVRVVVIRSWFFGHVPLGLSEPSLPPPLGSTELSLPLSLWRQLSPQLAFGGGGGGGGGGGAGARVRGGDAAVRCARTTHHTVHLVVLFLAAPLLPRVAVALLSSLLPFALIALAVSALFSHPDPMLFHFTKNDCQAKRR